MARGVAGYRKGQAAAEQQRYERDLQERELQSRAAQEFVRNAQWERQHAYTQQRDQMVDQRMRDLDAAEEQRRAEQKRADMLGSGKWESADDTDLGVAAETAMSVLGDGIPQTRSNVQGPAATQRVQANIDGVEYAAPERKGFAYERVGGKLLRMDRQADANAPWMKAIAEAQSRVQAREDSQGQQRALQEQRAADQRALRAIVASGRGDGQPKPRPLPESAKLKVNLETQANQTAIRDLDRAIAATTGVKDWAGPYDSLMARARNGWGQSVMDARPDADNARMEYTKVIVPIIKGNFGATLTDNERRIISPYVAELDGASEKRIPELLSQIRAALIEAQKERRFAIEAAGVDTDWLDQMPTRPDAPAPTTGGRKPGQNPAQRTETPAERRARLLRGGS